VCPAVGATARRVDGFAGMEAALDGLN